MNINNMPKLGFGLMRLPTIGDAPDSPINIPQACKLVDAYMEGGYNYFDTAYGYHEGQSEGAAKEIVVKRYPRDSFYLATKLPIWNLQSRDDCDKIFNIQLERTGAGYFDFYMLHSVEDSNYGAYLKYDCFEWGRQKKAEGKIRHFGFSFHGSPELLDKLLTEHPELEFAQIQLNYADWNNPVVQSGGLYEVARRHNAAIIAMEPVKGGMLANTTPEIERLMTAAHPDRSIASWAMRFVASLEGVGIILSGMSNMEQVLDNINTLKGLEPMIDDERDILDKVVEAMATIPTIGCTDCRYCCKGCPADIAIPEIFKAVNTLRMYGKDMRPHFFYGGLNGGRAKDCIKCGKCDDICPQHLKVMELIEEASGIFDTAAVG